MLKRLTSCRIFQIKPELRLTAKRDFVEQSGIIKERTLYLLKETGHRVLSMEENRICFNKNCAATKRSGYGQNDKRAKSGNFELKKNDDTGQKSLWLSYYISYLPYFTMVVAIILLSFVTGVGLLLFIIIVAAGFGLKLATIVRFYEHLIDDVIEI